jgi:hypothetical protein
MPINTYSSYFLRIFSRCTANMSTEALRFEPLPSSVKEANRSLGLYPDEPSARGDLVGVLNNAGLVADWDKGVRGVVRSRGLADAMSSSGLRRRTGVGAAVGVVGVITARASVSAAGSSTSIRPASTVVSESATFFDLTAFAAPS